MGIIAWIILGAIAGFIANLIAGGGEGVILTILILGIVGAIVGGFIAGSVLGIADVTGLKLEHHRGRLRRGGRPRRLALDQRPADDRLDGLTLTSNRWTRSLDTARAAITVGARGAEVIRRLRALARILISEPPWTLRPRRYVANGPRSRQAGCSRPGGPRRRLADPKQSVPLMREAGRQVSVRDMAQLGLLFAPIRYGVLSELAIGAHAGRPAAVGLAVRQHRASRTSHRLTRPAPAVMLAGRDRRRAGRVRPRCRPPRWPWSCSPAPVGGR